PIATTATGTPMSSHSEGPDDECRAGNGTSASSSRKVIARSGDSVSDTTRRRPRLDWRRARALIRIMHLVLERNSRLTNRGVRTWRWPLVGVALVVSCIAFTLSDRADAPFASLLRRCAESRTQPYLDCVNAAVLQYNHQHPHATGALLSYVFDHARDYRRR